MIKIIPFRQSDSSRCGPAAVKMILLHYGIDATEDDICKLCGHTYELGCDDAGMKNALEHYSLAVEIYNEQTLEDVEYWIKHHTPVIVDWFTPGVDPGPGDMPNGHSGIIVDIDRENVYLMDPENAQVRRILREDFMRIWFDWRGLKSQHIHSWDDMVIRQLIVAYPKRLKK